MATEASVDAESIVAEQLKRFALAWTAGQVFVSTAGEVLVNDREVPALATRPFRPMLIVRDAGRAFCLQCDSNVDPVAIYCTALVEVVGEGAAAHHLSLFLARPAGEWLIEHAQLIPVSDAHVTRTTSAWRVLGEAALCAGTVAAASLAVPDFRRFSRGALSALLFGTAFLVLARLRGRC